MIIGLGHRKQVGKSTVGKILEKHGFVRRSMAAPLYEGVAKLAGIPCPKTPEEKERFKRSSTAIRVAGFMVTQTGRQWLEFFGTDFARGCSNDIWIALEDRYLAKVLGDFYRDLDEAYYGGPTPAEPLVYYDDIRFLNEAAMLREYTEGRLWRIDRPSLGPPAKDAHESEIALCDFDGWDKVISNDSSIAELEAKVEGLLREGGVI